MDADLDPLGIHVLNYRDVWLILAQLEELAAQLSPAQAISILNTVKGIRLSQELSVSQVQKLLGLMAAAGRHDTDVAEAASSKGSSGQSSSSFIGSVLASPSVVADLVSLLDGLHGRSRSRDICSLK